MPLTPEQFRAKGHGKTAPWVDLVNSEEWDTYGRPTEWLDDPSWLPFFLGQWQFRPPDGGKFPAARFKALRGALRRSCEALAAARDIPQRDLRGLNLALNIAGKRQLIHGQYGFEVEFRPRSEGWDAILAQIALSFANCLAGGERSRIKICGNRDCRWVFYDASKARTRRWCSDRVCGNRERVRRARARMAR